MSELKLANICLEHMQIMQRIKFLKTNLSRKWQSPKKLQGPRVLTVKRVEPRVRMKTFLRI